MFQRPPEKVVLIVRRTGSLGRTLLTTLMPDFDAALAFSELFASSPPGDFLRPVYFPKPVAMPANQLSISANFDLLGTCAACDTETALAPDAFKGRNYVRLIQFWGESHNFWLDCKKLNEADWQELKENLEQRKLTLIFQNALFDLRVLQGCKPLRPPSA